MDLRRMRRGPPTGSLVRSWQDFGGDTSKIRSGRVEEVKIWKMRKEGQP